jgi:hypothetical protein
VVKVSSENVDRGTEGLNADEEELQPVTTIEQELREDIARDQRRADLPARGIATVHAIHRRRHQLAFLMGVVAFGLMASTLVSKHVVDIGGKTLIDGDVTRLALAGFSLWIVMYAFSKERYLRRVMDERERLFALDGEIASGLLSAGLVLDAVTPLHARLELDELLPCIVDQGRGLVGSEHGVLFIAEERQPMQPVVDPGGRATDAAPIMELVAARSTVVGVVQGTTVDVGVPIVDQGELLAVLVISGVVAGGVNDDMSALLTRFGTAAGAALRNARRYEAAMFLLDVAH